MDVVVCGAQQPFASDATGPGSDHLVGALTAAGHRAALVRLPAAWEPERLFDAPLAWRLVPVDADLVIATGFPAYFVRHPRKVVWLLDQRGREVPGATWPEGDGDDALEGGRLLSEWSCRALQEAERLYAGSEASAERLRHRTGLVGKHLPEPAPGDPRWPAVVDELVGA